MRIAIVSESFLPSANGVTTSVVHTLEKLVAKGHDVLVIAPTSEAQRHEGAEVITTPNVVIARFPLGIPAPSVTSALDGFGADLIHVASPFMLGSQAISYATRAGLPSVAVYQTDISGYMQRYGFEFARSLVDGLVASIHRPATLNLAPTPAGVEYLRSLGLERVALWGRGVDGDLFTPFTPDAGRVQSLRDRIAPRGERIVGYVGRLAPEKQVARLEELFGLPNTRFVVVGDGPDRKALETRFSGHPVVFLGKLGGRDLADAYRAMDVFIHCGEEETFGQTIQEAQASGLPVVVADRGGPRYLVEHGVTGFLVNPLISGAYRDQVATVLGDRELRLKISRAARIAVSGRTWEKNNQLLLAHYATALKAVNRESLAPRRVRAA